MRIGIKDHDQSTLYWLSLINYHPVMLKSHFKQSFLGGPCGPNTWSILSKGFKKKEGIVMFLHNKTPKSIPIYLSPYRMQKNFFLT